MIRRFILRLLGFPQLTVAGRLPVVHTHEELNALIADRHAKGEAARRGWQTRKAGQ